jgi:hypothetical protein
MTDPRFVWVCFLVSPTFNTDSTCKHQITFSSDPSRRSGSGCIETVLYKEPEEQY